MNDSELLRQYAEEGAELAFTAWVQRRIGLVYTTALRRLSGDAHGAADVAQRVFSQAAREAAALAQHPSLIAWLYTATRHAALNLMREHHRREQRERTAYAAGELSSNSGESATDWQQISPVLDAAMDELSEIDREALLLRFFEGQGFAAVGERLRLSENTARMRVERALNKLQGLLAKRGITSVASAVGLALTQQAGAAPGAVPVGLGGSVAGAALAGAKAAGGTLGALGFMSSLKTTVVIGGALAICALLGVAEWKYRELGEARRRVAERQAELAALRDRARESLEQAQKAEQDAEKEKERIATAQAAAKVAAFARPPAKPDSPSWDPLAKGRELLEVYPELKSFGLAKWDGEYNFAYETMFREHGLTPEQCEAYRTIMRSTASFIQPNFGPNGETAVFPFGTMESGFQARTKLPPELVVGDRAVEYQRRGDIRIAAAEWAAELTFTDAPATMEQTQELMQIMMDTTRAPGAGRIKDFDWNAIMARAVGVLSPPQMQALATVRGLRERSSGTSASQKGGK